MTDASNDGKDNLTAVDTSISVSDFHEVRVQVEKSQAKPTDSHAVSLELFCAQDRKSPNKLSSRKIFLDDRKILEEKNESFSRAVDTSLAVDGNVKKLGLSPDVEIESSETRVKELDEGSVTSESTKDPEIRDIANGMLSQSELVDSKELQNSTT